MNQQIIQFTKEGLGIRSTARILKIAGSTSGGTLYDHWSADLASTADYYPGGMMMPGRNTEYSWSRMGAQKSPKDDEVYGKGNLIDMGDRHLDTRILRTPKTDRKAIQYPQISPYSYVANNPIIFNDPDGEELRLMHVSYGANNKEIVIQVIYNQGKLTNVDGSEYTGNNTEILRAAKSINVLRGNDERFAKVISDFETSVNKKGEPIINFVSNILPAWEGVNNITGKEFNLLNDHLGSQVQSAAYKDVNGNMVNEGGQAIKFVPDYDRTKSPLTLGDASDEEIMIHEMKHAWNLLNGFRQPLNQKSGTPENPGPNCEEVDGVNFQNIQRSIEGKEPRIRYGGKTIPSENRTAPKDYKLQKK